MPKDCARSALLVVVILVGFFAIRRGSGETPDSAHALNLSIIIVSTRQDAESVMRQLKAGADFAVLAREQSIDASAVDGGFIGTLDPNELRSELRDALRGHDVGQLTGIVRIPSGFAILKVLHSRPALEDLNPKRILALISRGEIRWGAPVSGQVEATAIMQDFPKPNGWNRDLREICKLRTESMADAESGLQTALRKKKMPPVDHDDALDQLNGYSALGQLFAYTGAMSQSIEEWKIAYRIASDQLPALLPDIEESLGTAYLHKSELRNDIYRSPGDLDIFPPPDPHAHYAQIADSEQAIEYYREYLNQRPTDLEVRWLLNLAYMTLGKYPDGVPAQYRILACPHFPHTNNTQLAAAVAVGKWETPLAFSKQAKPASFPPLACAANSAGVM